MRYYSSSRYGGKPSTVGNKTLKRKKAHQSFCREQVKAGRINMPDGTWGPMDLGKAMHRDMLAGYHLGGAKKKRGKAKEEAEE